MKTTLDIPDPLYKRAKIRAVELGTSLRSILLQGLNRELSEPQPAQAEIRQPPYWASRKLRPAFKTAWESGALSGGTESTKIISKGRNEG